MRAHYGIDWAFATQASLGKLVTEQRPEELHRWPLLRVFDAEFYVWRDSHLAVVLRDKLSGVPTMGSESPIAQEGAPVAAPSPGSISHWEEFLRARYEVGPRDMVMMIPIQGPGPKVEDDWAVWREEDKELWNLQLVRQANLHVAYLAELDARKGALVRAAPPEIAESLKAFRRDHPSPEGTGFLMMRLARSPAHDAISEAVRDTATTYGLTILRADEREYHADLFSNVLTYLYGCGFGVAVFERIEQEDFNPNVSLEVGYMLALGKPVCFLKDRTLQALHTDLIGKLYRPFDPQSPSETIPKPLTGWLRDKELIPRL